MDHTLPESPLPPCPGTPNCVRETHYFGTDATTLFEQARTALHTIGASQLRVHPETRRIDAVFTALVFKDDVALVIEPHADGSVLHIRSASRVGYSDLGVNRRRVRQFFRALPDQ
ncbi:MAG: DUF1499 domain-containing protein [Rhodothermales bacterium]